MMGANSIILLKNALCLILAVTSAVILTTTARSSPQASECVSAEYPEGCEYQGYFAEVGNQTKIDPCTILICNGHDDYYLDYIPCEPCFKEIETPPGECCPICQEGCQYQEYFAEVGNQTKIDPCTILICNGPDDYDLDYIPCEPCVKASDTPPGECCPICQNYCEEEGKRYELDSDFKIDDCNFGYCGRDGEIERFIACCGPPECPNPVKVEGVCCPRCEKEYCQYNWGEFYEVGSETKIDPCTTLVCEDRENLYLVNTPCDPCDNPLPAPPGECCPICQAPTERTTPEIVY